MTDEYKCPSPGDCDFSTDDQEEFPEHLNTEHAGEYQDPEWPDNEAGRAARAQDQEDDAAEDEGADDRDDSPTA